MLHPRKKQDATSGMQRDSFPRRRKAARSGQAAALAMTGWFCRGGSKLALERSEGTRPGRSMLRPYESLSVAWGWRRGGNKKQLIVRPAPQMQGVRLVIETSARCSACIIKEPYNLPWNCNLFLKHKRPAFTIPGIMPRTGTEPFAREERAI